MLRTDQPVIVFHVLVMANNSELSATRSHISITGATNACDGEISLLALFYPWLYGGGGMDLPKIPTVDMVIESII